MRSVVLVGFDGSGILLAEPNVLSIDFEALLDISGVKVVQLLVTDEVWREGGGRGGREASRGTFSHVTGNTILDAVSLGRGCELLEVVGCEIERVIGGNSTFGELVDTPLNYVMTCITS